MKDSVFTRIIKGEIPCHKVYEDDKTFAFLDINPLMPGHVLVIPKIQVDQVDELPTEDYQALFDTVKKVSQHIRDILQTERSVIQVLGYDVPHAHVHVIASNSGHDIFNALANHFHDKEQYNPSQEDLAKMAKKLAF